MGTADSLEGEVGIQTGSLAQYWCVVRDYTVTTACWEIQHYEMEVLLEAVQVDRATNRWERESVSAGVNRKMVLSTSTIISQSTPSILKHIANTLAKSAQSPHALLYVLSPASSLPESHLSDLVTTLTSVPNSVGCISAPLPLRSRESATAVSLALFKHPKNTPFRSTIPGRQPTSVGRWHTVGANEDTRARQSPATTLEEIRGITRYALPSDIRDLRCAKVPNNHICDETDMSQPTRCQVRRLRFGQLAGRSHPIFVRLSSVCQSGEPSAVQPGNQLFTSFSSQIGLLASPTPFLTGRPYTLFRGREIFSSGAVGLCLTSRETRFDVELPHLTAITGSLTVTKYAVMSLSLSLLLTCSYSAEGNLVHSLDGTNPAKLIISAMDKHNMNLTGGSSLFKEDQYYLGVLKDGGLHRLYQIMSGGPSRGTVSLEGEDGPPRGSEVKVSNTWLCVIRR